MDSVREFLEEYPALFDVTNKLDDYLKEKHPTIFGNTPTHPFFSSKRAKVIHDNLWGTVRFSWRELALIDSPIMQRVRDIHQTGLAYYVYPSARHSRFEHCLGTTNIASRVFDALLQKQGGEIRNIVRVVFPSYADQEKAILKLKQELRLAAILHDSGHSLFSHTSERVYEKLGPLDLASKELTKFVGKKKGAGEVLSFCFCLTSSVKNLLDRAGSKLIGDVAFDDYDDSIDIRNVALMIVGRAIHPFLQFLGDIISSGFDADKLDYLLRDAKAAGLPLNYDIDRYLYDVRFEKETVADDEGELKKLYDRLGGVVPDRLEKNIEQIFPHYETYRLRLSKRAMNVIEQIVICKMMLFSYIYHHGKVRASEGLFERLLNIKLEEWRNNKESDDQILIRFIDMTDSSIREFVKNEPKGSISHDIAYRLTNRFLPREVYSISGPSSSHAEGAILKDFLLQLHENVGRERVIKNLEREIGKELIKIKPDIAKNSYEAMAVAGVWVDAPKPPKFEDVDAMVGSSNKTKSGVPMAQVFPIREWTEAYEHYRYQVRIFAYSEYWTVVECAAKAAMKTILKISGDSFYNSVLRERH